MTAIVMLRFATFRNEQFSQPYPITSNSGMVIHYMRYAFAVLL